MKTKAAAIRIFSVLMFALGFIGAISFSIPVHAEHSMQCKSQHTIEEFYEYQKANNPDFKSWVKVYELRGDKAETFMAGWHLVEGGPSIEQAQGVEVAEFYVHPYEEAYLVIGTMSDDCFHGWGVIRKDDAVMILGFEPRHGA